MPISPSARVHPSAVIDPRATIGDGVEVGPFVVIDGPATIGPRCVLRARSILCGQVIVGEGNDVGVGAVLGERPQHLAYTGEEDTRTVIGDFNIFREGVTIHRGTPLTGETRVGDRNFMMVNSHIGHDSVIGSNITMANGSLVAGHCEVQDRAFLSGNAAMHQFSRIGRLAFLSGNSGSTRDLLPFMTMAERDQVVGINKVGMLRAGLTLDDVSVVRRAYKLLFRERLLQRRAIEKMDQELGDHPLIQEILTFINTSKRGFVGGHHLITNTVFSEAA